MRLEARSGVWLLRQPVLRLGGIEKGAAGTLRPARLKKLLEQIDIPGIDHDGDCATAIDMRVEPQTGLKLHDVGGNVPGFGLPGVDELPVGQGALDNQRIEEGFDILQADLAFGVDLYESALMIDVDAYWHGRKFPSGELNVNSLAGESRSRQAGKFASP
jgi:hypothetical protein